MGVNGEGLLECPSPIDNGGKDCIAPSHEVASWVFKWEMAVFIAWLGWTTSRGITLYSRNVCHLQLDAHLNKCEHNQGHGDQVRRTPLVPPLWYFLAPATARLSSLTAARNASSSSSPIPPPSDSPFSPTSRSSPSPTGIGARP